MKEAKTRDILLTNALVFIVTILGVLISLQFANKIPSDFFIWLLFGLMVLTLALLGYIYFQISIKQLAVILKDKKSSEFLDEAIPSLLKVKTRQDHFLISGDGSAIFKMNVDIDFEVDDLTKELIVPIIFEESEELVGTGKSIEIDQIVVNSIRRTPQNKYFSKQLRKGLQKNEEGTFEYGILRVPIDLEGGMRKCKVEIQLKLLNAFKNAFNKEFVVIDIPHLTENIRVTVEAEDEKYDISQSLNEENKITASSGFVEYLDKKEMVEQESNISKVGRTIVWKTKYPKLGYRYQLFFKLESAEN